MALLAPPPDRYFNPRAHTGRDQIPQSRADSPRYFNPRAHTGRDRLGQPHGQPEQVFQSPRPHGTRR